MANNPYTNKVQTADGSVLIDITDTTAEAADVANGRVFYAASGARSVGTQAVKLDQEAAYVAYSQSGTYSVGDIRTHQGKIYRCTTAISTAEEWNSTHWTEITLSAIIGGKADKVSNATSGNVAILDSSGNIADSGKTLGKSVPSNAVFTDTTYSEATSGAYGLVKIGYTASGKNYPVQLSNGQMYVNVPWTDTLYPYRNTYVDADVATKYRTETKGNTSQGAYIANTRTDAANVNGFPQYGSCFAFGIGDTHGHFGVSYNGDGFWVGGGNADKLNWISRVYTTGNKPSWGDVQSKPTFSGGSTTLAWGTQHTIANVAGNDVKVTMPANPNTWRGIQNNLTSTSTTDSLSAAQGKALQDNKLDKSSYSGLGSVSGGGANNYFLLATITITTNYANYPIVFEVSRRQYGTQRLMINFNSQNDRDPSVNYFTTDGYETGFWVKKKTTSVWEIYGRFNEVWGWASVQRIYGCGPGQTASVAVNMTVAGTTAPGGTQVSNGWGAIAVARSTSTVAADGGQATIPYPNGYSASNSAPVYSYIESGGSRYFTSVGAETLDSSGIHVTNYSGTAGYVYVGLAKVAAP